MKWKMVAATSIFSGLAALVGQAQQQTILTTQQAVSSSSPTISELGVRFVSDTPGRITAIRYFRMSNDAGTHVGHLWSAAGQPLASVLFTGETATGWQQQALQAPVTIAVGVEYSVSVNSGSGGPFAVLPNAFASPIVNGHLKAIGGAYGTYGLWDQYQSQHLYFRDVVFEALPVPPVVSVTAPVDGSLVMGTSQQPIAGVVSGLSPGSYQITVSARDGAGQVASASSTVIVPRLLQSTDLVYQGAFRLPKGKVGGSSFDYGGTALAFNPVHNSLFIVGHDWQQDVAEIAIPAITATNLVVGNLPTATVLQPFTDATEGLMHGVTPNSGDNVKVGGLLPYQGKLYLSAYVYYDGNGTQQLSHFVSGPDFSVTGDVKGPFQVGTSGAGFIDGYFGVVPPEWQAALGGPVLNGQCCLSVISRTSFGPAVFAIDPTQLGVATPLPAVPLVMYPQAHQGLGPWGADSTVFNGSTNVTGVVFPVGSRSILFFGKQGIGPWCYGDGTANQALAGTTSEPGVIYCYDPTDSSKGGHGYPYAYYVWAYDAVDLAAVKSGTKQPWDIKPYATWSLTLPFPGGTRINGATYDPATGRIFVTQQFADGDNPLVHVFTVKP